MKSRRCVTVLLLFAAVVAANSMVRLWPTGPRPCRETFERVEKGMSLDQVVATVGAPPGAYTDRPRLPLIASGLSHSPEGWYADDAQLVVYFDQSGRADMIYLSDPLPDNRSFGQRVRDRLGL